MALNSPTFPRRQPGPLRAYSINTTRKVDPTHTGRIRASFQAEVRRRFRQLIAAIERELPAMIGGQRMELVRNDDQGERFIFDRSPDKVAEFMTWLRRQARRDILDLAEGADVSRASRNAWSNIYIDTAYQRAIRQAGANLKRGGAKVEESWVREAFNRPIHADRVGLIYTRTFEELVDVTEVMARQMSQVLAQGMAEGKNPLDIARSLRDRVEKIGITRARLIARTEVISAHAEATLNSYEEAGVEGVEVESEWSTAGDDRVCPECEGMEGRSFTLAEARGMIPAHPNCRCAWLPKVIGGSGIVLNWRRRAPRNTEVQRRRPPARALRGALA